MKLWIVFEDGYSHITTEKIKFNELNKLKVEHGNVLHIQRKEK